MAAFRRGPRLRLLRRQMAEPQPRALSVRPLPLLWGKRTCPRQAAARRHRTERPCRAAFALLGGMARKPEGRGSGRSFNFRDLHEDNAMTAKKLSANAPTTVVADDPEDRKGRLKNIGGSQSDHWNN